MNFFECFKLIEKFIVILFNSNLFISNLMDHLLGSFEKRERENFLFINNEILFDFCSE